MNLRPIHLVVLGWAALGAALFIMGRWTLEALHLLPTVVVALQHSGWSRVVHGARPGWL